MVKSPFFIWFGKASAPMKGYIFNIPENLISYGRNAASAALCGFLLIDATLSGLAGNHPVQKSQLCQSIHVEAMIMFHKRYLRKKRRIPILNGSMWPDKKRTVKTAVYKEGLFSCSTKEQAV